MIGNRQFWVTVYKSTDAFYPEGVSKPISCNHQRVLDCGINTVGEIVSLPGATYVPGTVDVTDLQNGSAMVPQGTIFPDPAQFVDNFRAVTLIKDLTDLAEYYVDTAEYDTNVVSCNPSTHN